MIINGIRCDVCGKESLFDEPYYGGLMHYIPDAWLSVFVGKVERNVDIDPFVFCSKHCLHQHPLTRHKEE